MGLFDSILDLFGGGGDDSFSGTPEVREQVSNLTPSQLRLQRQRERQAKRNFRKAENYYRDILSDNPEQFDAFAAPEMRRFQEQIVPDLAEQFAGMGSGALSSSGFRNAAVGAGADLSERLAAIRAGLRQNAAGSLANLGQMALTPHTQWQVTQPAQESFSSGLLSNVAPALGTAFGAAFGGPIGGAIGNFTGSLFGGSSESNKGKSSPYGNQSFSSQLPSFNPRAR